MAGEGQSSTGIGAVWDCLYPKRCRGRGGGCSYIFGGAARRDWFRGGWGGNIRLALVEADGHGVKRKGAEEVAAHALLDLNEGAGRGVDPVDGEG